MDLSEYFEKAQGHGILATSDASGKVDAAMYARPHFTDEETLTFIMAERLTHQNLQSNPYAAYLFIEARQGYSGKRLYLKKTREETNEDLVKQICRKCDYSMYGKNLTQHVVFFSVEKVLPLVGSGA